MDDFRGPIEGSARFGLPYIRIAVVVAVAAGVLGLGLFGPHPGGGGRSVPSGSTPLAVNATKPAPGLPVIGSSPGPASVPALPGIETLSEFLPAQGQLGVSWLPGQITSRSMALIGRRLFFVVDGDRIESTEIGRGVPEQSLVAAPQCDGINQIAAAGHMLAYVVTSPGGPTAQIADCGAADSVSWSVWLLDLDGGQPRRVAGGLRAATTIDVAEFPIHLALTDAAYAFDRPPVTPDSGAGETVEVHGLDGGLLWASQTDKPVADVMLGGGTLAVLTDVVSHPAMVFDLWTSEAAHPALAPVDQPARSASLSPDGAHLTWDVANGVVGPSGNRPVDVASETVAEGREVPLDTPTDRTAPAPLRPAIWSVGGRLAITWFATAPGGAIYPAVRYATGAAGTYLPSVQEPMWMQVQGGTLVWVAESADGWSKVAFAVDLATLGLH